MPATTAPPLDQPAPRLLRDSDGSSEVCLYFTDPHVDSSVVLPDVEIEILVLHPAVATLRQLALEHQRGKWQ